LERISGSMQKPIEGQLGIHATYLFYK
jgi:hypothetical protein